MKKYICFLFILLILVPTVPKHRYAFCETENLEEAEQDEIHLPILMYHAVFPNNIKRLPYSVHLSDLQSDLDYIKSEGYTTILAKDLIEYCENEIPLPEKPIMLTFDDGYYSVLSLVLPELQARNMKAVAAVVGKYTEKNCEHNDIYGYLDYNDIKTLEESGHIEIANHSDYMHEQWPRHGMMKKWKEDEDSYKISFQSDLTSMQDKLAKVGVRPIALAYPFGFFEKNSDNYAKELGFKVSFSCREKINKINKESNLFGLCRFNRDKKNARQILENCK